MTVTAENITAEQLHELARDPDIAVRGMATEALYGESDAERAHAREQCADILNARATKERP